VSAGAARACRLGALVLSLAAAAPALDAAEPRSAIPWLSESIEIEGTPPPPGRPRPGAAPAPDADAITVTPLGRVTRNGIGLLPPSRTGFAPALWGPDPAAEVRDLVLGYPDQGLPEAHALFHRLLLAESDPPPGSGPESGVLVARIDRLLGIGSLQEAAALIDMAGADTPDLFRRWFDTGLLLDRAAEPCAALRQNPSLSPTLPARVFCLARGGDWNAAEITLMLGQEVGAIPEEQQALLARFLDPDIFEGEPEPPAPEPLTALDFLMREAIGLTRPPGRLPLAFLGADLNDHVPMRTRVEAAERLALSGAVGPSVLFAAYRSGTPAASGGLWDRAQAVQALDTALAGDGDPGAALLAADAALTPRGLRVALAEDYAGRLVALDPGPLAPEARQTLVELLLLGREPEAAARAAGPEPDAAVAGLLAIAGVGSAQGDGALMAAALDGLTTATPADERERALAEFVAGGRQGRAIIEALGLVQAGAATDPPALRAALLTLRLAGQTEAARALALQTLLAGGAG
jgi:hypothetical protein